LRRKDAGRSVKTGRAEESEISNYFGVVNRIRCCGVAERRMRLLFFGGEINDDCAEQDEGGEEREEKRQSPCGIEPCGGDEGLQMRGVGDGLLEVDEPVGVANEHSECGEHGESEGKEICAGEWPGYSFDGGVAAAQLGSPPDGSGIGKLGESGSGDAGLLEGAVDEHLFGAGVACGHVGADLRRAGMGPVASGQEFLHFRLMGTSAKCHEGFSLV
jgi:hypothetical protein